MNHADLTAAQAVEAVASRQTTARDLTRAALDRIESIAPSLNCIIELLDDDALDRAQAIDDQLDAGEPPPPLAGLPILVKDNICLDRGHTTCASKMLEAYRSPFTATALKRLEDAGAVVLAKTNLDEFAMGSSGEHSAKGPTKNPWDTTRVPGGSSAGSAAAVAARLAPAALGSDTGGSVRQPAAFTGTVGLKPTYSRISRYGLVAYASSLDQIGPITRTVEDAALLLAHLSGHDPLDSTSANLPPVTALRQINTPIDNLRIAVPTEARTDANHPAVADAFERAIRTFESLGATIVDAHLPHLAYAVDAYYIVAPAEASSNLARYDAVRYARRAHLEPTDSLIDLYTKSRTEGLGPEVQRRILLGTHALSSGYYDAYYLTALKVRRLIARDFESVFSGNSVSGASGGGADAIIMPTAPTPPWRIGAKEGDPLSMYLEDVYTVPANLAGLPAISIPMGFAQEPAADGSTVDLPLGLQIYAPAFEDEKLLRIARMFEQAAPFTATPPELVPNA